MKINRVLIVIAVVLIATTFYEARLKPQSRPLYERALSMYRQENYSASLLELERAYQIEPNSTAILVLMGWNQLKLKQYNDARSNFSRASRLDPTLIEPQLGLAYVALETGKGDTPLPGIRALLEKDPSNKDFQLASAVALRQNGQNLEAAEIFHDLMGAGRYGDVARRNLVEMYGLEGLNEPIPRGIAKFERPAQLQVGFRASGKYLQYRSGSSSSWAPFYVKGVNIVTATPGNFPSEAPARADMYGEWLGHIAELGANTVRAYTILPPAFYRALKAHNEKAGSSHLYLLQQVWLLDSDAENFFQSKVSEDARAEVRHAVDVIHGQGNVPERKGRGSGLYTADVSAYTLGFIIGRILESYQVVANNELNSFRTTLEGKYINVSNGSPTEVWLASLVELAASYEVEKYNHQRPIAIANWPGMDPLPHPTETSLLEEVRIRRNQGERSAAAPSDVRTDDHDAVTIDDTKFTVLPSFQAGLFSAYSIFPFYPDFMYREPSYLAARDREGPDPYFGYLKALKAHYQKIPLVVVDYGASTSLGVSRIHPLGWHHGGLSEKEQGDLLARMTHNIADAGLAGGVIYGWQDEWHRANWITRPLAIPSERRPLWNNRLDADQGFGLWTYEADGEKSYFAGSSGWGSVSPLYQKSKGAPALNDGWDAERSLRSLSVASDASFVYVRLQVDSLRKGRDNVPDLKGANYYIGISTAPGQFGSQTLPGLSPQVRTDRGVNFLLYIGGTDGGRAQLLIAQNYNPRALRPIAGLASVSQMVYRLPYEPKLEKWSPFEEMVVETNRRRFSRDGRMFPPVRHSYSDLRYRPPDSADQLATWTCDFANKAFVFRLPWALLLVGDPSSRQVLAGAEGEGRFYAKESSGLELFAISLRPAGQIQFQYPMGVVSAADSLPGRNDAGLLTGLKTYSWPVWNAIRPAGRRKTGYTTVQKAFREIKGPSA